VLPTTRLHDFGGLRATSSGPIFKDTKTGHAINRARPTCRNR
jgi:hypothetical protein